MSFDRLIRFVADDGKTYYGNLEKETPTREIQGSKVEILDGGFEGGFKKTGSQVTVSKVSPRWLLDDQLQEYLPPRILSPCLKALRAFRALSRLTAKRSPFPFTISVGF
jgi:hypothetical protein